MDHRMILTELYTLHTLKPVLMPIENILYDIGCKIGRITDPRGPVINRIMNLSQSQQHFINQLCKTNCS
jgi:hypothetical protein